MLQSPDHYGSSQLISQIVLMFLDWFSVYGGCVMLQSPDHYEHSQLIVQIVQTFFD